MSRISVVIISWNARAYLKECLESLLRTSKDVVREIIVVDNASKDGSPEMVQQDYPEVILVNSGENLGFARANNVGFAKCTGEFVALVNSDVVVHPDCFQRLVCFLDENSRVGLVGPKVFGRDGKIQRTCGRLPTVWNTACHFFGIDKLFPNSRYARGFQMSEAEHTEGCPVEALSGCFCVARKSALAEVGGLDEKFFFYAEDVDWSKRFQDSGWGLAYVPAATIVHFGGGSSNNAPLKYTIEMLRANLVYWRKHHGPIGRAAFYLLAMGQHFSRLVARLLFVLARKEATLNRTKLKEHAVCIRWLVTGKGV